MPNTSITYGATPPKLEAVVFDLDGTILHTLPDLAACANEALAKMGFPGHELDEYRKLMGYGGRWLMAQAVPERATDDERAFAFELWRALYIGSDYPLTKPFSGIVELLSELRARGLKTAVLSNKFHEGTCILTERHFPGMFDDVRGDMPPAPRKPDPTTLLQMLERLGVQPESAAYVGDSNVDVKTARNAGVLAVGVSWGYDYSNPLCPDQLDLYVDEPSQLLDLFS